MPRRSRVVEAEVSAHIKTQSDAKRDILVFFGNMLDRAAAVLSISRRTLCGAELGPAPGVLRSWVLLFGVAHGRGCS